MEEIHKDAYKDDVGLLTAEDMAFIHQTLGRDILTTTDLNSLLNDRTSRAKVLDSPSLFEAMMANSRGLEVSEYFFYCTIVRQVMLTAGLEAEEYTQNVASSLVRMAGMRRKLLDRDDSSAPYVPVENLRVLREDGQYGSNLRISCRMDPYELLLEGFIANVGAIKEGGEAGVLHAPEDVAEGGSL